MNWKRIIRNTMLVLVGLVGLLLTFEILSKSSGGFFATPAVKELAEKEIVNLNAPSVQELVRDNLGKPQLLFIYASWCPFCKRQFVSVNQLRGAYNAEHLTVHYISVDDDIWALAEFINKEYPDKPFKPYHVEPLPREAFYDVFRDMGYTVKGGIPLILLLDKEGKPFKQFTGLTEMKYLLENIEKTL